MTELPKGWVQTKLSDLCSLVTKGTTPTTLGFQYQDAGVRFVKVESISGLGINHALCAYINQDAHDALSRSKLSADDILFSIAGTLGRVALVKNSDLPANTNQALAIIRPIDPSLSNYLSRHLLSSVVQAFASEGRRGTGLQNLNLRQISDIPIALAPLPEQDRIVAKIDSLTGSSARVRHELGRIPKLIEHYKHAILAKAFDFISADKYRPLGELSSFITSGSRGWARYYSSEGPIFVRVGNVRRNAIDLELCDIQHVTPPHGAEGRRTSLEPSDIVITITADLGRVGVIGPDLGEAYVNQHIALVRLHDPSLARCIAWSLCSPQGQLALIENDRGMTRSGLGLDDIRAVRVPFLSSQEALSIVDQVEDRLAWLDKIVVEHTRATWLLPKLDQAILTKAFRGELVPQDQNDEPASALLDRIRADRQRGEQRRVRRVRA